MISPMIIGRATLKFPLDRVWQSLVRLTVRRVTGYGGATNHTEGGAEWNF